jgi:hypothetical protein
MVSIFITDTFIGEEVNPEKKHHQAYTPMGEKKPGVVYKRKYRKAEDLIQPITTQLLEEFCIIHNIIGDPLENMLVLPTHPPTLFPASNTRQNGMRSYNSIPTVSCGEKRRSWRIIW